MRGLLLLLVASAAWADASAPSSDDWCRAFYRDHASAKPPERRAVATDQWKALDGAPLRLRAPADYLRAPRGAVFYLAKRDVVDPLHELASGWEPILAIYRGAVERSLEAMKDSGDIYPATVTQAKRNVTLGGRPAVEVCAVVARSPGHGTLGNGHHVPLPTEYDLVRAYQIGDFAVLYRVEQPRIADDEPLFAAMLGSVR